MPSPMNDVAVLVLLTLGGCAGGADRVLAASSFDDFRAVELVN